MPTSTSDTTSTPAATARPPAQSAQGSAGCAPVHTPAHPSDTSSVPSQTPPPGPLGQSGRHRAPQRGLSAQVPSLRLREAIAEQALSVVDRFRVARTLDIAAACFPERPFKAALTAAQRAVRGLVRQGLLRRYKTERFQTVYGLTQRGADWLGEQGYAAASASVRRVSDMTNPEHRLWAQFMVLCAQARGWTAWTEAELLHQLSQRKPPAQGYLTVEVGHGDNRVSKMLRPDAVAFIPGGKDVCWFEIDRSKRGSDRLADLAALARAVGRQLTDGRVLRLVSVQGKTERITRDAVRLLEQLVAESARQQLVSGRRQFRCVDDGVYAVWSSRETRSPDGRVGLVDACVGHVVVQLLPTWMPKLRVTAAAPTHPPGWFEDNLLPFKRPSTLSPWAAPVSPLVPLKSATD